MAYDEELANRIRTALSEVEYTEKTMFGGLGFMVGGNMAVAAGSNGGMMLRVDPARSDALVEAPGVEKMVMRGRAMDGWLDIAPAAVAGDDDLARWVGVGVTYAKSLPPK